MPPQLARLPQRCLSCPVVGVVLELGVLRITVASCTYVPVAIGAVLRRMALQTVATADTQHCRPETCAQLFIWGSWARMYG